MDPAVVAPQRDDTAVTAAQAAAHDALHGHLAWPAVPGRGLRRCGQHAFGTAGVDHHARAGGTRSELAVEWRDDPPQLAGATVFRRQHEIDSEVSEEIQVEKFRRAA